MHLTATILLEGVAIVTEAAELAVLPLRVVQALEAPPGLLVTGFWVRRVDVVVTLARLTRAPRVRGIAKEARGTVVASGACCPIKPAWDLWLCPLKGLVPRHSRQPEGPPRQRLGPQCASYRAG